MDLRDYLRILERRKWVVAAVSVAVFIAALVALGQQPPSYRATAHLYIADQPYVLFDKAGLVSPAFSKGAHAELIRTNNVLKEALALPGLKDFRGEREMTEAIDDLRSRFRVVTSDATGQLTVTSTSGSPELARAIVNTVAQAYHTHSMTRQKNHIQNTLGFINKQISALDARIQTNTAELQKLPPIPDLLPFSMEEEALSRKVRNVRQAISENESRQVELEGEIAYLNSVASGRNEPVHQKAGDGRLSRQIWKDILTKERELGVMLHKYTPRYPPLIELRVEIDRLREEHARALDDEAKIIRTEALGSVIDEIRKRVGEQRTLRNQKEEMTAELVRARQDYHRHVTRQIPPEEREQRRIQSERRELLDDITAHKTQIASLRDNHNDLSISGNLLTSPIGLPDPARGAVRLQTGGRSIWLMLFLSLLVGVGAAWSLELLNTTIRTEYDVRRYVNLPMLGAVQKIKSEAERLLLHVAPQSPLSEVFNTISTLLEGHSTESGARTFMVAGSNPEEGKSTIMANLAISLARSGSRVVLIDADMRKAMQHQFFGIENDTGLSSYLTAPESITFQDVIRPTSEENLWLLPAGPTQASPVGILKSDRMNDLLQSLRSSYDYVLVDVPPVRLAADTLVLAPRMDAVIMLISAGETSKDDVTNIKRMMQSARGTLLGAVLNKVTINSRGYYYYYRYYSQPQPRESANGNS